MKRIELSQEQKAHLQRIFKVSKVTIWSALTFQTDSHLARRIRTVALREMKGRMVDSIDVTDDFIPNCETDFVHGNGGVRRIIHTFSNGVRVEFDNDMCTADISRNGRSVKTFSEVKIRDWGNIVFEAQSLTDSLNERISIHEHETSAVPTNK